jgi:cation transport protein ChaC
VVTLIDWDFYSSLVDHHVSQPNEKVWGAAYHIPAEFAAEMIEYLDIREAGGYSAQYTTFIVAGAADKEDHGPTPDTFKCLVYIGLPENPHFLGPQEPQTLADHILKSKGPSGENREYLFMLEESLRGLDPQRDLAQIDLHVSDLVRRCRDVEARRGQAPNSSGRHSSGGENVRDKTSGAEEQEEIEK